MIGTDYPFPWTSTEVDLVLSTPGLSDDERIAILGGTAAKLLGIKSWSAWTSGPLVLPAALHDHDAGRRPAVRQRRSQWRP